MGLKRPNYCRWLIGTAIHLGATAIRIISKKLSGAYFAISHNSPSPAMVIHSGAALKPTVVVVNESVKPVIAGPGPTGPSPADEPESNPAPPAPDLAPAPTSREPMVDRTDGLVWTEMFGSASAFDVFCGPDQKYKSLFPFIVVTQSLEREASTANRTAPEAETLDKTLDVHAVCEERIRSDALKMVGVHSQLVHLQNRLNEVHHHAEKLSADLEQSKQSKRAVFLWMLPEPVMVVASRA